MKRAAALVAVALLSVFTSTSSLRIGVGRADMTGPSAEVAFMGYANPEQRGRGIHLRQFARSFIMEDETSNTRIVFISTDAGMMGTHVRREVLKRLSEKYSKDMYTEQNVMLSGTHTHSTPGGFLLDIAFDLNSMGFVNQTFEAYVNGIVRSVSRAHDSIESGGSIKLKRGMIENANINRSPTSYLNNPAEERARYPGNTDTGFVQLSFHGANGEPRGVLTWFAVHATSMNNTNRLVSSDNVGLASLLFEEEINKNLPGQGDFVAAFASTNLGDVSPNIAGPRCQITGAPCDDATSTCPNSKERCVAFGPGKDMVDSTRIIAHRIFDAAYKTWQEDEGEEIGGGPIKVVHQYVDMPKQQYNVTDPFTGVNYTARGCSPAMGYSFAAGTTDGPGMFDFKQGTKSTNPLWNLLTDILAKPSAEMIACQAPKPILLATGEMNYPFEWQPSVVSTQLGIVGKLAIACVPGEFTTMSGRRMRNTLGEALGVDSKYIVIAGLCNTYSDYITTPEEYQMQRYEAASTIFGPHTLVIYQQQYSKLAKHLMEGTIPERGPEPPSGFNDVISLLPGVVYDYAGWGKKFGDVSKQPPSTVHPNDTVSVKFVSGNPRNNLLQESSYLTVDRLNTDGTWTTVATDANWETRFIWTRKSTLMGTSEVEVRWKVPAKVQPGKYRITHRGARKHITGSIEQYSGKTQTFQVVANNDPVVACLLGNKC